MNPTTLILAAIGLTFCLAAALSLGLYFYLQRQKEQPQPHPAATHKAQLTPKTPLEPVSAVALAPAYQDLVEQIPPPRYTGRPWLEGVGGVIARQRIDIKQDETVIGRSRVCDVQIHDPKISRQHAMLRLYKDHYFIQDMQSSRGTQVNQQVIQTHLLKSGDEIRIGDSVLIFRTPNNTKT